MGGVARSRTRVWGLRVVSYFRTGPMRRLEGFFSAPPYSPGNGPYRASRTFGYPCSRQARKRAKNASEGFSGLSAGQMPPFSHQEQQNHPLSDP
jgi:hypothetical protein